MISHRLKGFLSEKRFFLQKTGIVLEEPFDLDLKDLCLVLGAPVPQLVAVWSAR